MSARDLTKRASPSKSLQLHTYFFFQQHHKPTTCSNFHFRFYRNGPLDRLDGSRRCSLCASLPLRSLCHTGYPLETSQRPWTPASSSSRLSHLLERNPDCFDYTVCTAMEHSGLHVDGISRAGHLTGVALCSPGACRVPGAQT
jgi:hypothetical protein